MAMNIYQHQHQTLTPYEQRLRDEVLYLHSLWHRGPPALNPNPNPNFLRPTRCSSYSNNNPSRNLHVSNSISFKKIRGNKHRNQTAKNITISISDPLPDPGPEWPVNPPPSSPPPNSIPAWPSFKEKSSSSTRTVPDIDEAKIAAMQMQYKVVKSCNRFFAKRVDLGSEEDGELDEEDEEDDSFSDDDEIEESKEFKFFFNLFVENRELRNFYENNSQETGEFYCLVCAGIGVKLGKNFKGCLGLVQHAITVLNTKRKRAHRAFGLVICGVLGWDISRLPVIVLKGEPLSQSLANLGETLNCLKEDDAKEVIEDFDNGVSGMDTSQRRGMDYERSEPSQSSDIHWLCSNPVDESQSTPMERLAPSPPTTSVVCAASAEEQTSFSIMQLQLRFSEECRKFFSISSGSDGDEDEDDISENDLPDENEDEDGSKECEEFKFFLRLFTEGNDLRNYYENHYEDGEFYCIVCHAIGKKVWKRFKGCISLLQHSIAISRTKKKRAHRAFGQVICKVLAWDIDRLPTIVLKGEPLRNSLKKSGISQTSFNRDDPQKLDKEDITTDRSGVLPFQLGVADKLK